MKCCVVRDLLPTYAENLCEMDTVSEIQAHLEQCETCSQMYEGMQAPVESTVMEAEKVSQAIQPLKKYKKKLKKKNMILIVVILFATLLLGGMGYLTYGQITKNGESFETIAEYVKFQHVAKEFAEGNVEPLLKELDWYGTNEEYFFYALQEYHYDEEAYGNALKKHLQEKYSEYFEGGELRLKKVSTGYESDVDSFILREQEEQSLFITLTFEVIEFDTQDKVEYMIGLQQKSDGKYFFVNDLFCPLEELKEGTESWLYNKEESLFAPIALYDRFILSYKSAIVRDYELRQSKPRDWQDEYNFYKMYASFFTTENLLNKPWEIKNKYHERLAEQLGNLKNLGYDCMDLNFDVISLESFMYRMKVTYTFKNEATGELSYLSTDVYRNNDHLLVIPDTVNITGATVDDEAKTIMKGFWNE